MTKAVATRGRPRKAKSERAPTVNFTMRLRPSLLEELRRSAEQQERSISAEAESRLSQPAPSEISRMIGSVIEAVERRASKSWREDMEVFLECRTAVDALMQLLFGIPTPERSVLEARYEHFSKLAKDKKSPLHKEFVSMQALVRNQLDALDVLGAKEQQAAT